MALAVAVLASAAAVYFYFFREAAPEIDFVLAERGEVIQEVSVTGKVEPAESVELAFEKGGKVVYINVKIGSVVFPGQKLAGLDNSELAASLAEAKANVAIQEAKLAELLLGTRPEEIEVQRAKVKEAGEDLLNKIKDAYTKADDAVRNKVDQFISSPRSSAPALSLSSLDSTSKSEVEAGRVYMESLLNFWKTSVDMLSLSADATSEAKTAKENLLKVRGFLEKVALAVNSATANSIISQATLDGYRTDVATARTNVNTALNSVSAAESNLAVKEKELELKMSGTLSQQIEAQKAQIEQTKAKAENLKAQLLKTELYSPLSGVVTKQDAKVGEIVPANSAVVSVISRAQFNIKTNVSEVDIAKIKVGNEASVTLDAYGNDVQFGARVTFIDPAETVVEGVSTYKVTLEFFEEDEKIKSGMTADLDIKTDKRSGVVYVPQRAVITQDGEKFVQVLGGGQVKEVPVKTGLRGSDGRVEIMEGVKEGDKVVVTFK